MLMIISQYIPANLQTIAIIVFFIDIIYNGKKICSFIRSFVRSCFSNERKKLRIFFPFNKRQFEFVLQGVIVGWFYLGPIVWIFIETNLKHDLKVQNGLHCWQTKTMVV